MFPKVFFLPLLFVSFKKKTHNKKPRTTSTNPTADWSRQYYTPRGEVERAGKEGQVIGEGRSKTS